MSDLTADRFPEFFQELWGQDRQPFAWQQELARRVLENHENPWPEAIALPTASGKTACLDIAVYALAAQANGKTPDQRLTAPRRVFYVVDRRLIVDEAFERARKLAGKLRTAENGILREVADRLRTLGGGGNPLACFQLRGGMYRSDAWAKNPTQATIVASTVDQLGSRLLFRAYGRSCKAWPIQAGLAANDALILLDEAHCTVPFLDTLQSVRKYRRWAEQPLTTPFHVAIMSATPPEGANDVFRDTSEEPRMPEHPLGARQMANKPSRLVETKASGSKATEELAKELTKVAEDLAGDKAVAVVVFSNRVATARRTHELLARKHADRSILLTGRMRPMDKDDTVMKRLAMLSADVSGTRQLEESLFVVATQTLEVGANFDFDKLVSECASLDALRQRFGRLNRMGRKISASAAILIRRDQARNSDDDPIYGAALSNTWKWLKEQVDEKCQIDMGIASLAARLPDGEELARLNAPTKHAPVMLPAHVDCWAQTAPEPVPTPEVSVFLHGPGQISADVQVCWRADLDLDRPDSALEILTLCPPTAGECLAVPIWLLRRWLSGGEPSVVMATDVEGVRQQDDEKRGAGSEYSNRRVVQWRGRDEAQIISDGRQLRPGDVIVIPSSLEGWDMLGDLARSAGAPPVLDWGERAHLTAKAKALLRLHPAVVGQWPDFKSKSTLLELANQAKALFEEDPDALLTSLGSALGAVEQDESAPAWLKLTAHGLVSDRRLRRGISPHPLGEGIVLRGSKHLSLRDEESDCFSDEDDSSASGTVRVNLEHHLQGVAEFARRFASACGLPPNLIDAISCAGLLHDLGKADPRFQALLGGGNPWARGELLAKSADMPQGRISYLRACKAVGYPVGGRHELLSVRLAESGQDLLPHDADLRDLVLHLVGSHHGHCRPFAPVVFDDKPVMVRLHCLERRLTHSSETGMERINSGAGKRFWSLTRRYGWWGLAYMEAILRLADHRRSEWEEIDS